MSAKRVVITAGGTGGHLYPAQAFAQELKRRRHDLVICFAAAGLGSTRHFDRETFCFKEITGAPLFSRNPLKVLRGVASVWRGLRESILFLKNYRPEIVVGFGSYYTVPVLLAARWLKIPIVLHEANSIPGRANKWLAPLAMRVGVHFPSTAAFFGEKGVEVGLPLRDGYQLKRIAKEAAMAHYGFSKEKRTLLICGGSQGARAINALMVDEALTALKHLSLQVIHLTGEERSAAALQARYEALSIPARVKAFETDMQMAWRAADLFIGRSGASTIAEAVEFEVPGLLIPYPHATDQHQEKNADFLVDTVKSARKCSERSLTPLRLSQVLTTFCQEAQLAAYTTAVREYKQCANRLTLGSLVLDILFRGCCHE